MAAATSRTRAGSSLRSLRAERLSVLRGRYESAIEGRRSLRRRVDSDDSARRSCSSSLLVRFFAPSCPRNVGVGAIGSNRLVMLCFRLSRTSGSLKPALPTVHGTVSIESLQPNVRAKTLRFVKQKVIVATCRVRTLKNSVAKPVFELTLQPMNSRLCEPISSSLLAYRQLDRIAGVARDGGGIEWSFGRKRGLGL
jgi:hypothetical protein